MQLSSAGARTVRHLGKRCIMHVSDDYKKLCAAKRRMLSYPYASRGNLELSRLQITPKQRAY